MDVKKKIFLIILAAGSATGILILFFLLNFSYDRIQSKPEDSTISAIKEEAGEITALRKITKPLDFIINRVFVNEQEESKKSGASEQFFQKIKEAEEIAKQENTEEKILLSPKQKPDLIKMLPPDYIKTVSEWRKAMVQSGNLSEKEQQANLDKFDDIVNFLEKMTISLENKNIISKEEKDSRLYGLKMVWGQTLKIEQNAIILNFNNGDNKDPIFLAIESLMKKILPKAEAVGCFKIGVPNISPGVNLWAPCCYCDCGIYPCGCLNSVCPDGMSAIYDLVTGICGCG